MTGGIPLLVECLNFEKGCNGGTGTSQRKGLDDELEGAVRKRGGKQIKANRQKVGKAVKRYWKSGLYGRVYRDKLSANTTSIPDYQQKMEIFLKMDKNTEKDLYYCVSCGSGSSGG